MSMTQEQTTTPESKKTFFRTKDLNQAAFLWTQDGVRLVRMQGSLEGGNTIYFQFEMEMSEEDLQNLQFRYANNECLIEPNLYVSKQNALRDLLHSGLGIQIKKRNTK
jgi:uncharacterized protein YegP (UPF0339 family)